MWIIHNKFAMAASVLAIVFVFAARQWNFDVWEFVGNALNSFDQIKGHEIIFMVIFSTAGYGIDAYKRRKKYRYFKELAEGRLEAMKATMTTVQDIVNNALNSLQLFRIEAQKHPSFCTDAIDQFDTVIFDTANRLRSIQTSEVFVTHEISDGFTSLKENLG